MIAACSAALLLAGESVMICSLARKGRPSPAAVYDGPLLAKIVDLAT
jgi:hypothetical protein